MELYVWVTRQLCQSLKNSNARKFLAVKMIWSCWFDNENYWSTNFWFKIWASIFSLNLIFRFFLASKFRPKFQFWSKFRFLTKISIFDQNFHFWPKFPFLAKISIFGQNFHFCPKFPFLAKISIFGQHFQSWPKFPYLGKFLFLVN